MDDGSRLQLDVLRQLNEAVGSLGIRFWLRGGWAIDFMLGDVTRSHADLDLVTWQRHRKRIAAALTAAGFELDRELPVQTDWRKDGQDITFVFVERQRDGRVLTHGVPDGVEWLWRADAFPERQHTLHGVPARVVDPRQLLTDIEEWEEATGRPLRDKDHRTIEILRSIIARSPL